MEPDDFDRIEAAAKEERRSISSFLRYAGVQRANKILNEEVSS
jgi:uncharacterized protein (DUF1778 family)